MAKQFKYAGRNPDKDRDSLFDDSFTEAKDVSRLVEMLMKTFESSHSYEYLWRGEALQFPTVQPLIDRLIPSRHFDGSAKMRCRLEAMAMRRFCQNAAMYIGDVEKSILDPAGGFTVQVLMRHYGAPTRLLDWTRSPWVALHAICRESPTENGRLMRFDASELSRAVDQLYPSELRRASETAVAVDGEPLPQILFADLIPEHDWVARFNYTGPMFPRILAQQGTFTLASRPWVDHWQAIRELEPMSSKIYLIGPEVKTTMLRHLRTMNINVLSLNPDIHGVAMECGEMLPTLYTPIAGAEELLNIMEKGVEGSNLQEKLQNSAESFMNVKSWIEKQMDYAKASGFISGGDPQGSLHSENERPDDNQPPTGPMHDESHSEDD